MQSISVFLDITKVADLSLKELKGTIQVICILLGSSLGKV